MRTCGARVRCTALSAAKVLAQYVRCAALRTSGPGIFDALSLGRQALSVNRPAPVHRHRKRLRRKLSATSGSNPLSSSGESANSRSQRDRRTYRREAQLGQAPSDPNREVWACPANLRNRTRSAGRTANRAGPPSVPVPAKSGFHPSRPLRLRPGNGSSCPFAVTRCDQRRRPMHLCDIRSTPTLGAS
jgi:hypothetical protein